jgi:hypothetical protein
VKESDLNRRAIDYILARCSKAVYYKIADKFTAGIPDSVLTWSYATSWLEFKLLDPNEVIHDQLDKKQLVELVKLQHACHRAWVVAFRRQNVKRLVKPMTEIYMPSALWPDQVPTAHELSQPDNVLRDLRSHGIARFEGHCYEALYRLMVHTHVPF